MPRSRRRSPITPGAFTVAGVPQDCLYGRRVVVTWRQGALSGDPGIVAAALERAAALRECLADPAAAMSVLVALFIPGTIEVAGDVPARPPIPEGAIGGRAPPQTMPLETR